MVATRVPYLTGRSRRRIPGGGIRVNCTGVLCRNYRFVPFLGLFGTSLGKSDSEAVQRPDADMITLLLLDQLPVHCDT